MRGWFRKCNEGSRGNVQDEEKSGRRSVITDELIQLVLDPPYSSDQAPL